VLGRCWISSPGDTSPRIAPCGCRQPRRSTVRAVSFNGTFETCRPTLKMSAYRRRPEVIGPKVRTTRLTDAVEKVFSGRRTKFFSHAGASHATQREGPHRITKKRSQTIVLPYIGLRRPRQRKTDLCEIFRATQLSTFSTASTQSRSPAKQQRTSGSGDFPFGPDKTHHLVAAHPRSCLVQRGSVPAKVRHCLMTFEGHMLCLAFSISEARSPMTTQGAIVLPVVTRGMIEPSAIRRLSMPWTLREPSTTDIASCPILAVHV
jgi:hypothetical protein